MRMVGSQHSRDCDMQPEKFSEDEFMTEIWRCFKRTVVSKKKNITVKEVLELSHDTCKE